MSFPFFKSFSLEIDWGESIYLGLSKTGFRTLRSCSSLMIGISSMEIFPISRGANFPPSLRYLIRFTSPLK